MSTHHTPAPSPAESSGAHGGSLPPVALEFADRLRHLPLGAWVGAADAVPAADLPGTAPGSSAAGARARLRLLADDMPGVVAQMRMRVDNLVGAAEAFVHRSAVGRMKKTALTAALALVARPALGEEDFARLYAPFVDLIPPRDLVDLPPDEA